MDREKISNLQSNDDIDDNAIAPATITAIKPSNIPKENQNMRRFLKGAESIRNQVMQEANLSDEEFANMVAFAVNIAGSETGYGNDPGYKLKALIPDSVIDIIKHLHRGTPVGSAISRGLTQIKYQNDIKDTSVKNLYDRYGITEKGIETDPFIAGKATVLRAIIGQKYLRNHNNGNPYLYTDNTVIPNDIALSIVWNYGHLTSGKNPNITDLNADGATAYGRRFEQRKLIR